MTSLGADTQGRNASQEVDGTQPSSTPGLEEMFRTAAEAFRLAAGEEWICGRMAGADTTCAWHVTDADFGLTALLDRKPIEVVEEAQDDAEIHVCGSEEAWLRVFSGQKHMGIALAEGELDWSGPVRKFLGIFPIFRRAYVDVVLDRDPGEDTDQGSRGGDATAESASEGEETERQDSEQQDSERQETERQDSEQQGTEDQNSERQGSGQQVSRSEGSEGDTQGRNASQEIDGAQPSSTPSLEEMFGTAAEAFRLAAGEEWLCGRMAGAQTTCAWHVTDADFGLTALLDRAPIEVVEESRDDAEVHICGAEEAWLPVFAGEKHMGIALAEGDLDWTGPVRKFLSVYPIFRRAYVDVVLGRDPGEDTDQGSRDQEVSSDSASEGD